MLSSVYYEPLALITMPNPIIVANIDEPPYDIIGNGDPTIGSKPSTIDKINCNINKNCKSKSKTK